MLTQTPGPGRGVQRGAPAPGPGEKAFPKATPHRAVGPMPLGQTCGHQGGVCSPQASGDSVRPADQGPGCPPRARPSEQWQPLLRAGAWWGGLLSRGATVWSSASGGHPKLSVESRGWPGRCHPGPVGLSLSPWAHRSGRPPGGRPAGVGAPSEALCAGCTGGARTAPRHRGLARLHPHARRRPPTHPRAHTRGRCLPAPPRRRSPLTNA